MQQVGHMILKKYVLVVLSTLSALGTKFLQYYILGK